MPPSRPFAPEDVAERFRESLEDAESPAYGQVATVDERGHPQLRTVHLRMIPERDAFGFCCHVRSAKWRELAAKPALSGCWVDYKRLAQFRWEGRAQLIGPEAEDAAAQALLDRLWSLLRPDVRKAYWQDYGRPHLKAGSGSDFDVAKRCPGLGAALCLPERWDVFDMDPADYTRGRRVIHAWKKGLWIPQRVSLLHGTPAPAGGGH